MTTAPLPEFRRPGRDAWESPADLPGGRVPMAEVVGTLVRFKTGDAYLVFVAVGVTDPDASGARNLLMEVYSPPESQV